MTSPRPPQAELSVAFANQDARRAKAFSITFDSTAVYPKWPLWQEEAATKRIWYGYYVPREVQTKASPYCYKSSSLEQES